MKIAIIAPYWNPPLFEGGVSRVIFELRKIWLAQGHKIHVYASITNQNISEGIFKLPSPRLPLSAVWNNAYLSIFHKLSFYDIIFSQSAIGCLFTDRKKCVPFIHTLSEVEQKVWWRPWRYTHRLLEKLALRKLPACIALSDDVISSLVKEYGFYKSVILKVSNGVDYNKFTPGEKEKTKQFTIFTAGRFIPRKRFDLLIRAFALLVSSHDNVKLLVAGDGPLKKELKALTTELNIMDKVKFLGFIKNNEMLEAYRASAIFVLPSKSEGMPMVVLEAQSFGLPVIIGNFASSDELIEDGRTGFIIKSEKPQDWSKSLSLLYEDVELRKILGKEARNRIVREFGWKNAAMRIMGRFEDIATM